MNLSVEEDTKCECSTNVFYLMRVLSLGGIWLVVAVRQIQ